MSDDNGEIIQVLEEYLRQRCSADITAETDLVEAGVLESLMILDLHSHVEQKFGVSFQPQDFSPENFRSLETLARLISRKQNVNSSANAH